ncbi:unnamed protein product, partial [Ectocarpus sp. 4 AP-2014]
CCRHVLLAIPAGPRRKSWAMFYPRTAGCCRGPRHGTNPRDGCGQDPLFFQLFPVEGVPPAAAAAADALKRRRKRVVLCLLLPWQRLRRWNEVRPRVVLEPDGHPCARHPYR